MNANDQPAQFPAPGAVRLVRTLPGPIERIWDYLTDPERRARWFAGGPMEPRGGGHLELFFHHANLAPEETPPDHHKQYHEPGVKMPGTVLRWEPPRVLSYTFDDDSDVTFELTPKGKEVLLVLGPGWEEGCRGCSFVSDHFDGALAHLRARDVSFAAVSSAPLDEILRFKARMSWRFPWVSSHGSSFNRDFGVSFTAEEMAAGKVDYNFGVNTIMVEEMPGLTVFAREPGGAVCRTYSTYARGLDLLVGAYNLLDLVPKGRDEDPAAPMSWVRHHDRYGQIAVAG